MLTLPPDCGTEPATMDRPKPAPCPRTGLIGPSSGGGPDLHLNEQASSPSRAWRCNAELGQRKQSRRTQAAL